MPVSHFPGLAVGPNVVALHWHEVAFSASEDTLKGCAEIVNPGRTWIVRVVRHGHEQVETDERVAPAVDCGQPSVVGVYDPQIGREHEERQWRALEEAAK